MKQRINWIDWAKSFCMFLVILGHTHICTSQAFVIDVIYSFHIPLFFFLSGLLCKDDISFLSIKKDFKYLLLPYLFYGMIGLIIPYPIHLTELNLYLTKFLIGTDASIGAIWFLPAIFICKQIGKMILCLYKQQRPTYYILFFLSFFLVIIAHKYTLPFFLGSALCGLPFFLLGHEFMRFYNKSLYYPLSVLVGIIVFMAILTSVFAELHEPPVLAICSYGDNLCLYYVNAISGIATVTYGGILLDKHSCQFVTVTSYGSIVTLWAHGVILSIFNYYIYNLIGIEVKTYTVWQALIYAVITYICCYYIIIIADRYLPKPFGLRGTLHPTNNHQKKWTNLAL